MDKKKLREIISLFKESGLSKMEISETSAEENFSLKLENAANAAPVQFVPMPAYAAAGGAEEPAPEAAEGIKDYNKYRDVKSPMVGVFYASPSPSSSPFFPDVSKVKKGDTLCIIEAMKLMTDVVAEEDGEIVEMFSSPSSLCEFGQTLFKLF